MSVVVLVVVENINKKTYFGVFKITDTKKSMNGLVY